MGISHIIDCCRCNKYEVDIRSNSKVINIVATMATRVLQQHLISWINITLRNTNTKQEAHTLLNATVKMYIFCCHGEVSIKQVLT